MKSSQTHKKSQSQSNMSPAAMLMFLNKMQNENTGNESARSPLARSNSLAKLPSLAKGYTESSPTGSNFDGSRVRQLSKNSKRFFRKMTAQIDEIQE